MIRVRRAAQFSCAALGAALLTHCDSQEPSAPVHDPIFRFSTLVGEVGIDLITTSGTQPSMQILEVNGGQLQRVLCGHSR